MLLFFSQSKVMIFIFMQIRDSFSSNFIHIHFVCHLNFFFTFEMLRKTKNCRYLMYDFVEFLISSHGKCVWDFLNMINDAEEHSILIFAHSNKIESFFMRIISGSRFQILDAIDIHNWRSCISLIWIEIWKVFKILEKY